nr:angiotensin-converting enzyme-like [Onthophagus taurus]
MFIRYGLILLLFLIQSKAVDPELEEEVTIAINFLNYMNQITLERNVKVTEAEWNYVTNITDETFKIKLEIEKEVAKAVKEDWEQVSKFHWETYKNPVMKRKFKFYSLIGSAALPPKKFERLSRITSEMQKIYSTAKLCEYKNPGNCSLNLEPELTKIFAESRNPKELKYYWSKWRKAVGPKVKVYFDEYVSLSNEASRLNKLRDYAHSWLLRYEADDFRDQLEQIWQQVKPLYLQLHAYVRFKLREKYGDLIPKNGLIPAHLLGNMWAQSWANIADFSLPYPDAEKFDVTEELIKQGYTPLKMFQLSNDFFVSLNLTAMPEPFWEHSILEKPDDGRDLVCHASAWDFYQNNDARIKQCTVVSEKDLITVHHEMGHIQYYLQYANQPVVFRDGANPGFHEAVGDVITLSVKSPKHLSEIGLLNSSSIDDKMILNILYNTGLDKIAFLPFAYIMDLWRWDIFEGKTSKDNQNCKWWDLREEYQGISPPITRSEEDFDPAAKYHVSADVPYIRYFVSFIIQFQFHRALCIKAGEFNPDDPEGRKLYECDIYKNKDAGNLLGKMLQMGSSQPWPDAMEVITGQRSMDASGLLEYFRPLLMWLKEENAKNNVSIGWEPAERRCKPHRLNDGSEDMEDEEEVIKDVSS